MWPFKKKKTYFEITQDPDDLYHIHYMLEAWWDNMKPDWVSIKKICPNIPTSWYVQVSDNVCYTNNSRGIYG